MTDLKKDKCIKCMHYTRNVFDKCKLEKNIDFTVNTCSNYKKKKVKK